VGRRLVIRFALVKEWQIVSVRIHSAPVFRENRQSSNPGGYHAPEAEITFDRIGIQHRKRCADLVRGTGNIIDLLSCRLEATGFVDAILSLPRKSGPFGIICGGS
tara:strand:- start:46 stop:360 length:315 start_codon:yes stop_codon:yes gene_type:complete